MRALFKSTGCIHCMPKSLFIIFNDIGCCKFPFSATKAEYSELLRQVVYNGEGVQFIAMEMADLGPLTGFIVNTDVALGAREFFHFIIDCLSGFRYLHETHKLAHLDVKPDNLYKVA